MSELCQSNNFIKLYAILKIPYTPKQKPIKGYPLALIKILHKKHSTIIITSNALSIILIHIQFYYGYTL
jgi:hypothetical protein